jgi:hypothetical protein
MINLLIHDLLSKVFFEISNSAFRDHLLEIFTVQNKVFLSE